MYVRKEALLSSQIEGTQCTLDDLLDPEVDVNANQDVGEVINHIRAVRFALNRRRDLPLCGRFFREIHAELLRGSRGQEKEPGQFRRSQNWIGPAGGTLKEARSIPPHVDDMTQAMGDLELFLNENEDYDPLIQAALIHYQFETIHPFLDGNGRIGRLLILLYFIEKGLLAKPVLCISFFLKKNQVEYYDRMDEVRRSGNYEQWVAFFLEAVSASARDTLSSIERMVALHDGNVARLPASTRRRDNARILFEYVEQHPLITIGRTAKALGVSYNTVSSGVEKLVALGILRETTNASRNRVFVYEDYLDIVRP